MNKVPTDAESEAHADTDKLVKIMDSVMREED